MSLGHPPIGSPHATSELISLFLGANGGCHNILEPTMGVYGGFKSDPNVVADLGCFWMLFCTVEKGLLARA
jgi:hypothetical protein